MDRKIREKRFWSKVEKTSGCWIWTGTTAKYGYGKSWNGEKMENAHRVSWWLAHGPIPKGKLVLHHCDNPPCVNPGHLFIGTHKDNTRDMINKNRKYIARGSDHPRAKLTEKQVVELRRRYRNGEAAKNLAKDSGVSLGTFGQMAIGRTWKHLPGEVERGNAFGTQHAHAVLTEEKIIDAHKRANNGESLIAIAREYGCFNGTLGRAVKGETWKHLKLPPIVIRRILAKKTRGHKLTDVDVREIRLMKSRGKPTREIARHFSISIATVYHIFSGIIWSHVT